MENSMENKSPGKRNGMSKMDGVRNALAALGNDAQPIQIRSYVKEKFGMEMSTAHVSNYKTAIMRKQPVKASHTKVKLLKKPAAAKAAPGRKPTGVKSGFNIDDLETVKALVVRVGQNNLKTLIGLFGK
jgi:hypothetical protein